MDLNTTGTLFNLKIKLENVYLVRYCRTVLFISSANSRRLGQLRQGKTVLVSDDHKKIQVKLTKLYFYHQILMK